MGKGGDRSKHPIATVGDKLGPQRPADLSPRASLKWSELTEQLPKEILSRQDVHLLAAAVNLLVMLDQLAQRIDDEPGDAVARRQYLQGIDRLMKLNAEFGLSPVSRAKMRYTPEPESTNPLDYILQGLARPN